jgi:methylisocitrate lyase
MSADTGLRSRFAGGNALVVPGVGTPLEAHAAVAAGFDAIYLSGYATAAWGYGQPDVGLIALDEIAHTLEVIAAAVDTAIIVDADTGYGDVLNVRRTVERLEHLGAQAIQLEDQEWPKRCGHFEGKRVVPGEVHARKIAAAVAARRSPETAIIARTDALAPNGLTDALERAKRYADAGADALFVDAPTSIADLEAIAHALSGYPLIANMSESGRTPQLSAQEFHDLGFSIVLFPSSSLRIAARAFERFYSHLREHGDSRAWLDDIASLSELNTLVGLDAYEQWEAGILSARERAT